eukprot:TRINITY_DN10218_c0_g2_i1.p1 TRINITY_DN10218_c0_g2~~TRINITY_DN10218_c0_g2_i1.p1  ORF type:complete len:152 (-),score=43.93 TRINITY_DN10218_c0_g2_i1:9-464(-)
MNHPPSTRQGIQGLTWPGALEGEGAGGYCEQPNSTNPTNPLNGACMLFSQPSKDQPNIAIIPGEPTLNAPQYRTHNVDVSSGPNDWTRKMPWRAPGSAPVLGSGCGVAAVSYTHLRAHETVLDLVCRLLLEKKKKRHNKKTKLEVSKSTDI